MEKRFEETVQVGILNCPRAPSVGRSGNDKYKIEKLSIWLLCLKPVFMKLE